MPPGSRFRAFRSRSRRYQAALVTGCVVLVGALLLTCVAAAKAFGLMGALLRVTGNVPAIDVPPLIRAESVAGNGSTTQSTDFAPARPLATTVAAALPSPGETTVPRRVAPAASVPIAGREPSTEPPVAAMTAAPAQSSAPLASEPLASTPESGDTCGDTQCPTGKVCCNASCGTCVNPGEQCSQQVCGMPSGPDSVACGPNTCNVGEVCCNASCGTCVRPGQSCDQRVCDNAIQYPFSVVCGMATCNAGTVCCNPSCGICAPPGEACSHRVCG